MRLTRREIIGLVMGILPFLPFLWFGLTFTKNVNGIIEQTRINLFALLGGIIALIMAFRQREALRFEGAQFTAEESKMHSYVCIGLIGLGTAQLINFALGIF